MTPRDPKLKIFLFHSCYYLLSKYDLFDLHKFVQLFFFSDCVHTISKLSLFEEWLRHGKKDQNRRLYQFLASSCDVRGITEVSLRETKNALTRFSSKLSDKWAKCGKNRDRFFSKNSEWIAGDLVFHVCLHQPRPSTSRCSVPSGRPQKQFEVSCSKTKRRRVEDLLTSRSTSEIMAAAEFSARLSGKRNLATVIKGAVASTEKCKAMKESVVTSGNIPNQRILTKEEALAYYVDSKATTHSYKQTRKWSLKAGHQVFPSFYSIRKAKAACFPPENQIFVDEIRAEIKVQAILNITVERLIAALHKKSKDLSTNSTLTLISKWGCDGSSGHSTYKQKFISADQTDEFLFVFSLVPLQLRDQSNNIVWQNPRPSSTMYCRPIKFIFSKENTDFTVSETNKVSEEINSLLPTISSVDGHEVSVKHELLFTMIDGKVCNAVTGTASSQKCYLCGATPKFMNDESREFTPNSDNFSYGLSTLHAWIRCFECLLHISYRLDVKKWQLRDAADKINVKQRSVAIQSRFKNEMGLIVDKPKPGYGNTNDGNTARRFFGNSELSAEITGIDLNLIQNFNILLRALSSGYDLNIEKFSFLAKETKTLYLSLYSWYYMPVTVHKILVHSVDIIKSVLLPIGQLSEEAQEARNKDCRRFREHNTRKRSRSATNRDLLNMLVITSDPLINSLREVPKKYTGSFAPEVLDLLIQPSDTNNNMVTTDRDPEIDSDHMLTDSPDSSEYDSE